jgi:gluconate 2-dehydrogenase gamma chain
MESSGKSAGLTRRRFMAVGALGSAAAAAGCHVCNKGNWDVLTVAQARTLGAICDQIVPADDFPGATQAGVLDYIDRQLMRHFRRYRDAYRDGLERAETLSRKRFGRELASLGANEQLEIVSALEREEGDFFRLVRNHTLEGYYGSPRHGGNRDAVSWRMLGMAEPPLRGRAQYDLGKGATS